ncbi:MAG: hypothetical protein E7613_07755 [Ruminococcaceae bacterium]|nr:hypothetical protein [Oscillospiraceae bacterium]
MINIFTNILDMSLSASVLILVVLLIRTILKRSPKWVALLLWCLVAIRLVCPFTIKSPYSMQPKKVTATYNVVTFDGATNELTLPAQLPKPHNFDTLPETNTAVRFETPYLYYILSVLWCIGVVAMIIYAVVSYIRIYKLTRGAIKTDAGFYLSDKASAPFVFGIFKPHIYIPFECSEDSIPHIIAHETVHISRLDHIWKPFGFLILSLHWFNPLVWLSYALFCRDLEAACDEKAVKEMSSAERADYAQALLDCSTGRAFISVCPVAFGENNVKSRIKSILNYKKPAVWIIAISVILCGAVAFFFMTEKKADSDAPATDIASPNNITVEKVSMNDINIIDPYKDELVEDTMYRFNGIHKEAVSYALDIGFDVSAKHYKSGASYGRVAMINHAHSEKVKADETVELYYMEYYYYENTVSPSENDKKIIYPMFFALHHNLKSDEWTRLGTITDYQMKNVYKSSEMVEKYGDEFTAAAAEIYKAYFHIDMGEAEQIVLAAYKSASNAASWFRIASILEQENEYPTESDEWFEVDGTRYFKVKQFDKYESFIDYLEGLFSKKLTEEFLNSSNIKYINYGGELYASLGVRGTNIRVGNEYYMVEKVTESKYIVKVTVEVLGDDAVTVKGNKVFEFPYEYIDDRWVFSAFPEIR